MYHAIERVFLSTSGLSALSLWRFWHTSSTGCFVHKFFRGSSSGKCANCSESPTIFEVSIVGGVGASSTCSERPGKNNGNNLMTLNQKRLSYNALKFATCQLKLGECRT